MNMKRVFAGILAAILVAFPKIAAAQGVEARAVVSKSNPSKGEEITVAINIDMSQTGELLGSYSATLAWNSSVLTFKSTTGGTTTGFTSPGTNEANVNTGQLAFNQFYAQGAGAVVNIITVTLDVVGNPGDSSPLDLSFSALDAASTFTNLLASATIVDGQGQIPAQGTGGISAVAQIPNTTGPYASTIQVPIRVTDTTNQDIVAVEIFISSDASVADILGIDTTGTLVGGWTLEDTVISGADGLDTLKAVMTTHADNLEGAGDLFKLRVQTANTRQPASTDLKLVHVYFNEEDRKTESQSGALKLVGTDGTVETSPSKVSPGDQVTITVTDADENQNSGSAEQVTVEVVSVKLGDTEQAVLLETATGSGVFSGSITTRLKTSGATTDGTLDISEGDTVAVTYTDLLSSTGTTVARRDSSAVVTGTDGILETTYVVQARDDKNGLRDTLRVRVTDADLNGNQTQIEHVSVVIENQTSGEVENLQAEETGVSSGVFQIRVPTQNGSSGANNDGVLAIAGGNILSVKYTDALRANGSSQTIEKTTSVINLFGDVSGNGAVRAFDGHPILGMVLDVITASAQDSLVADLDGNCDITPFDVALLLQYLIDIIDRFPVQTDASLSGDTDWKNHPFLKPVSSRHTVALSELQAQEDGRYILPVVLNERDGIISGTVQVSFDKGVVVEAVVPGEDFDDFLIMHTADAGKMEFAFAGALPAGIGPGVVARVRIQLVGESIPLFRIERAQLNEQEIPVGADAIKSEILPNSFALMQNYPNPFNPATTIQYHLPEAVYVSIKVFNLAGQLVRVLENGLQSAGKHEVVWDGTDSSGLAVTNGLYLYRISAGGFRGTKKMILVK